MKGTLGRCGRSRVWSALCVAERFDERCMPLIPLPVCGNEAIITRDYTERELRPSVNESARRGPDLRKIIYPSNPCRQIREDDLGCRLGITRYHDNAHQ